MKSTTIFICHFVLLSCGLPELEETNEEENRSSNAETFLNMTNYYDYMDLYCDFETKPKVIKFYNSQDQVIDTVTCTWSDDGLSVTESIEKASFSDHWDADYRERTFHSDGRLKTANGWKDSSKSEFYQKLTIESNSDGSLKSVTREIDNSWTTTKLTATHYASGGLQKTQVEYFKDDESIGSGTSTCEEGIFMLQTCSGTIKLNDSQTPNNERTSFVNGIKKSEEQINGEWRATDQTTYYDSYYSETSEEIEYIYDDSEVKIGERKMQCNYGKTKDCTRQYTAENGDIYSNYTSVSKIGESQSFVIGGQSFDLLQSEKTKETLEENTSTGKITATIDTDLNDNFLPIKKTITISFAKTEDLGTAPDSLSDLSLYAYYGIASILENDETANSFNGTQNFEYDDENRLTLKELTIDKGPEASSFSNTTIFKEVYQY